MEKNKGKIIAISSSKGGVGKTIIALNLAGVYSQLEKKVLIVDLDFFGGNIATFVNSTNDRTIFNLVEDLGNNRYKNILDYIYNYNSNIDIIAAPKDPRQANKIDTKYIPIILGNVIYKYDVILIDTTHILSKNNIVTFDNCDSILYVFTNDTFDIKNTRSFMSIMKDANFDNVITVLNNSIPNSGNYFSLYDIKSVIKKNVDFVLDKSFYISNIDKYIMVGQIFTLNKNLNLSNKKDYKNLTNLAYALIKDKNKEEV